MTSQTEQQILTIHILSNISRNKDGQTMKFGSLIDYNIRKIFLEQSYTKWGREASPRPFYENLKLSISLDQHSEMLKSLLLLHVKVKVYQNILKLRC